MKSSQPAFSLDEKFLYVGDWNTKKAVVNRHPVNADATLGKGELFFDFTTAGAEDAIDGIKVDMARNVYVSGTPQCSRDLLSPTSAELPAAVIRVLNAMESKPYHDWNVKEPLPGCEAGEYSWR